MGGSALGNAKKNKENMGEKNKESEDGMMNEKEGKESEGGLGGFNDILGNLGSTLDKVKKKKENKGEEKKKGTGGGLDELLGNLGPLRAMAGVLAQDGALDGILNNLKGISNYLGLHELRKLGSLIGQGRPGSAKIGERDEGHDWFRQLNDLGSLAVKVKKNKENKGEKNKES